ncbi:MAG: RMD1 family protein [Bacteroidia bacterium]
MGKAISYQVADSINIEALKASSPAELVLSNVSELFYQVSPKQFISVFKYGAICFLNMDDIKIVRFIKLLEPYCNNFFEWELRKEFAVETDTNEIGFSFNAIQIYNPDKAIVRLILLNVAQSVALEYYALESKLVLKEVNEYSANLESKGGLRLSDRNLKRFIGKSHGIKNRLVENLFILDASPGTWEDEHLSTLDQGLKETLSMQKRSRNVHEELRIVREQLELFSDIKHHNSSLLVEWIIIFLILFEIAQALISGH